MTRCVSITKSGRKCKKSACYGEFCATHGKLTCCICRKGTYLLDRQILTDCGHIFCKECISREVYTTQWFDLFSTEDAIKCPECEAPVSDKDWNLITSFLCDKKVVCRKIVYDTYLCAELLHELTPFIELGYEYNTLSYFSIFNKWNKKCPRKYGQMKYFPEIDQSNPAVVFFKEYSDPLLENELVFRFFYGESSIRSMFEVFQFQKELAEYVFHPKRVERFGGWEYLEKI